MTHARIAVPGALVALAAALACPGAAAQDLPTRKAGLWEISIQREGAPPQVTRQCVDEATDRQMQQMGKGMGTGNCTKESLRKEGSTYVSDSECKFGPSTMTSHAVTSGDFTSSMRTEVDTRYDPPMMGRARSKTIVTAKWVGACPAEWKPGDMEVPGMGRVNVNTMMQPRPGAPASK